MAIEAQTWHYGLVAQLWAKFSHDTPELPYIHKQIQHFGQPVLDLACGTGRLLIPLGKRGVDIDGCDISGDMLALCQERADREDLLVKLYKQPMYELDLPRRYKLIYICGSFGIAGSRQGDLQTLRRCYDHLEEGGALVISIQSDYTSPDAFDDLLKEERDALPEPWPEEGKRQVDADGLAYISRSRTLAVDPLKQSFVREIRVEKWDDKELLESEDRKFTGRFFFYNEFDWLLRLAGFDDIVVHGDYIEQPATADHSELVFVAKK